VKKLTSGDTSELPQTPNAQVWIEDTNTAVHGHGGPGWEFGTRLWSPSSAEGGSEPQGAPRGIENWGSWPKAAEQFFARLTLPP